MPPNKARMTQLVFSPPHNWCDHRCQRCPIADCPVRLGVMQHDWSHRVRVEGPHSTHIGIEEVLHDFCNVMNADGNHCARAGVASKHQEPDNPKSERVAQRLSETARLFFAGVQDAVKPSAASDSDETVVQWRSVLTMASLLRIKAAGLTAYWNNDGWDSDALPNLLLLNATACDLEGPLQLLRETVSTEIWTRLDARYQRLRDALSDLLIDAVAAQELLDRLVQQQQAPSPFCTV